MATTISFPYEGKDYKLEFTRQTVKNLESRGITAANIAIAPATTIPELFAGAFQANHKFTDRKVIDEIYKHLQGRKELVDTLIKMYNEPIEALLADPEEGNGIAWTVG